MKIRTRIIISFLVLVIPLAVVGGFSIWGLGQIQQDIDLGVSRNMAELDKASKLNSLTQFIRYYDEVLTQSARNYAFTGDNKWQDRYKAHAQLLDKNIKEAISLGDAEDKQIYFSVDESNLALVKMEETAMNLAAAGKKDEAIKILESNEYAKQKKIYQDGLMKYVEKQGKNYNDTLTASTQGVGDTLKKVDNAVSIGIRETAISIAVTAMLAVLLGIVTGFQISRPIATLVKTAKDITGGNLNTRADIKNKDEIGDLALAFNEMTDKLQQSQQGIEAKVAERTEQLEKLNKFMTGRELRMIELKKQIQDLSVSKKSSSVKTKTWAEKFQEAVDFEESVVIKLQGSYMEAIKKAELSDTDKEKCLALLQTLVQDSNEHKNKFKSLEEEENAKQG